MQKKSIIKSKKLSKISTLKPFVHDEIFSTKIGPFHVMHLHNLSWILTTLCDKQFKNWHSFSTFFIIECYEQPTCCKWWIKNCLWNTCQKASTYGHMEIYSCAAIFEMHYWLELCPKCLPIYEYMLRKG